MDLREYLFRNRITITDFGKKIDCPRAYLSQIVNGHKKPGKRLAKAIQDATNDVVTIQELLQIRGEKSIENQSNEK